MAVSEPAALLDTSTQHPTLPKPNMITNDEPVTPVPKPAIPYHAPTSTIQDRIAAMRLIVERLPAKIQEVRELLQERRPQPSHTLDPSTIHPGLQPTEPESERPK